MRIGPKSIIVIGGYGRVGRRLSALLAADGARVIIAGRSLAGAQGWAETLRARYASADVDAARVNAADVRSMTTLLSGADLIVLAAPTGNSFSQIARAAIDRGCDCVDLDPAHGVRDAQSLAAGVEMRRCLVVIQGGLWPGLPSALARAVRRSLDSCRSVHVGLALSLKGCARPEQAYALVDAAVDCKPLLWRSGAWRKAPLGRSRVRMNYGPPIGERVGLPIDVPELHGIEAELGVDELGAFGATPAWRADVIARAAMRALYRVRRGLGRRAAAKLLLALADRTAMPAGVRLVASAIGTRGGVVQRSAVRLAHDDVAEATAIAVLAFLRQRFAERSIAQCGVKMMGHILDIEPALDVMRQLGLSVDWEQTAAQPQVRPSIAQVKERVAWDPRG